MDDMFRVSGTNLTVFVPKELDHHIAEMLNQKTDWIMEQKNIRRIVFDFRETDFMDSSGIGVIMEGIGISTSSAEKWRRCM